MSDKESLLKKEKKKKEEKKKEKEKYACAKCPHRPPQSFTPPPQKSKTIKKQTQKNYNKLLKITWNIILISYSSKTDIKSGKLCIHSTRNSLHFKKKDMK